MTLQCHQELDLNIHLVCSAETSAGLRQNFPARLPIPALRRAATSVEGHQLIAGTAADDVLATSRPSSRQVTPLTVRFESGTKVLASRKVTHSPLSP